MGLTPRRPKFIHVTSESLKVVSSVKSGLDHIDSKSSLIYFYLVKSMSIEEGLVARSELPDTLDSVVSVGHVPEGDLLEFLGAVGVPGPGVVVRSCRVENLV